MRLSGLDALRGIAALVVAWHHLQWLYGFDLLNFAAISAVDLFLVLSGFVMARTYEPVLPRSFVLLRYRRLLPAMAVGSSIGFLVLLSRSVPGPELFAAFGLALVFLPYAGTFAINVPLWSLFAEIIANALHWLVFSRIGTPLLAACAFALALIFSVASLSSGTVPWGSDAISLAIAVARCLCCYLLGIIVWRTWGDKPLGNPVLALVALPLLLLVGGLLPPALFSIVFAIGLAPLLLRMAVGLEPSVAAKWAGALSFPLYAVHFPIIVGTRMLGGGPFLAATLSLLAAVAMCGPAIMDWRGYPSRKRAGAVAPRRFPT